jgi:hypothetical protein
MTTPGLYADEGGEEIHGAISPRTETVGAPALRTNH